MSSNVAGEKKRRTSSSGSDTVTNGSNHLTNNNNSLLPNLDFASQLSNSMNTSPLLLVAAMASAWQNANPHALQRLQQHLRLQQQNDQVSPSKEEKPRLDSKKLKHSKKEDDEEKLTRNGSSTSTSPRSQSNTAWLPANSPTQGTHKVRKLKLYSADEKIDIIDYAKVIGNRAAGREFNVAESSIREWRKNEDRLRKQSETASSGNQRVELNHTDLIKKLDDQLVEFVESNDSIDWYEIRSQAQDSWPSVIKGSTLDGSADSEMQITMGWVARFMKRNENRVRRIAPPVIATANSTSSHNGSVSMVRRNESSFGSSSVDAQSEKTTIVSTTSSNPSPTSSPSPALLANTTSRRKCAQPRRAANATLMLTPDSEKPPSTEEHKDEDEPAEKRARTDEEENSEEPVSKTDSSIKVC